jgi:hypothetical protein
MRPVPMLEIVLVVVLLVVSVFGSCNCGSGSPISYVIMDKFLIPTTLVDNASILLLQDITPPMMGLHIVSLRLV